MDFRFCLCFFMLQVTIVASLGRKEDFSRKANDNLGLDPYTKIMASSYGYEFQIETRPCNDTKVCNTYARNIDRDAYLLFWWVDFQDGASGFSMVVANKPEAGVTETGTIYLHVDNTYVEPFAEVYVGNTGGEQNWYEVRKLIKHSPTGPHDLYVSFGTDNNLNVANIASITFYKKV